MRVSHLALAVAVATAMGWAGVAVASAAPPKCADLGAVPAPASVAVPAATAAPTATSAAPGPGSVATSSATTPVAAPPAAVGGQNCQIQVTDPAYAINITYPLDFPDQKSVFDYVKQTRDGFLNVAKSGAPRDMPYELDTTMTQYSSALPPRGSQTVVFKTYQGVGGAHPQTFYQAFNWDQTYRKPVTIDNLFKEGTAPFPLILPVVQAEVAKQFGQTVSIAPEAGLDPSKYRSFAITNDALIFFFDQGELLPEAAGAFEVSVPRGPIDPMIA